MLSCPPACACPSTQESPRPMGPLGIARRGAYVCVRVSGGFRQPTRHRVRPPGIRAAAPPPRTPSPCAPGTPCTAPTGPATGSAAAAAAALCAGVGPRGHRKREAGRVQWKRARARTAAPPRPKKHRVNHVPTRAHTRSHPPTPHDACPKRTRAAGAHRCPRHRRRGARAPRGTHACCDGHRLASTGCGRGDGHGVARGRKCADGCAPW